MPYFRVFLAYNLKKLLSHSPSNWSQIKTFHEIMKKTKFGTKNALFRYFWARIFKKLLSYLTSAPSNLSICKILRKNNFVYIWDKKCLIWAFSGQCFKKIMSYLKSAPLNLSNSKLFQEKKSLNLALKIPYFIFRYFWARI